MKTNKLAATVCALALMGGTTGGVYAAETGQTAASSAAPYVTQIASHTTSEAGDQIKGETGAAQSAKDEQAAVQDLLKLSDDGLQSVTHVHAARIALYNGDTEQAGKDIAKALDLSGSAEKDATVLDTAMTKGLRPGNARTPGHSADQTAAADQQQIRYLPLDAQISVQSDYKLKPNESGHLQNANAAMKKGDTKGALNLVSLIDQDVSYSYLAVPFDTLKTNLDKANADFKAEKFHQANLDLKAIEDAVVFNQLSVDDLPDAGSAS